jgi:hypothetical protein
MSFVTSEDIHRDTFSKNNIKNLIEHFEPGDITTNDAARHLLANRNDLNLVSFHVTPDFTSPPATHQLSSASLLAAESTSPAFAWSAASLLLSIFVHLCISALSLHLYTPPTATHQLQLI